MTRERLVEAPQDFEGLRQAILERRSELPKRLMQVAAYSLDHPDEIAFGTVASIASSAHVQPSTLVRFAQHLGFEGFSGLQLIFRARLRERNSSYEDRLKSIEADTTEVSENVAILNGFLAAAGRSIETLAKSADPDTFEKSVEILAKAETIYLIAKRRAAPISTYMAYAFGKLRVRNVLVGTAAGIDDDLVAMAGPKDAAIAISFSPYAQETMGQARALAARKIPLVAMTDSAFSPLAESATEWFEIVEADHAGFRSLSAGMALAMALTVAVAERRRRHKDER
ncbi:MurR/RpiR family transcriptional regulator [Devosia sp.]|uniref:MurR/RpiR family transcriptional regulator n=1 Tax=Devosia sp. TaxID=1871048 RepID=UPI003262EA90